MTFGEIVDHAQKRGCSLLKERLDKRKTEGFKVYAEPALRNAAGDIVSAPDGLMLPLRYDLAIQGSTGDVKTENADSAALNFREPVFANWENRLKIEINSISWDNMLFQFKPTSPETDWEGLRRWFLRWFDTDDEKVPDDSGLCGIVHFISDPEITPEGANIRVDFGSAASLALAEFFDELIKLGARNCTIGRPCEQSQFLVKD